MMRSAVVISLITTLALGAPTPDPFEAGLGIPAVVVDGHPIKVPEQKRNFLDNLPVFGDDKGPKSKLSIGDHTIEAGGGAASIGGHATGGAVGNDPGSSITIHVRSPEPDLTVTPEPLNTRSHKRGFNFITGSAAIGIGESAVGGDVQVKPDPNKKGSGIANGGRGGDALVPGSRAGNGGNGGIIID